MTSAAPTLADVERWTAAEQAAVRHRNVLGRRDYAPYMASEKWERRRHRWFGDSSLPRRCAACICVISAGQGNLHHRRYNFLGRERMRDLILLCRPCHVLLHQFVNAGTLPLEIATDVFITRHNPEADQFLPVHRVKRARKLIGRSMPLRLLLNLHSPPSARPAAVMILPSDPTYPSVKRPAPRRAVELGMKGKTPPAA